jgi:hypothetical protein
VGVKNPLTEILEEAEHQVRLLESAIVEEYGIPLYVEEKRGDAAFEWPADPEAISPEEMAQLVMIHGQDTVDLWLADYFLTKQQADLVAAEEEPDES